MAKRWGAHGCVFPEKKPQSVQVSDELAHANWFGMTLAYCLSVRRMTKIKSLEELTMTIQKKSLINSLNTTKKAIVASTPASGTAASGTVKPAISRAGSKKLGTKKLGVVRAGTKKLGVTRLATFN